MLSIQSALHHIAVVLAVVVYIIIQPATAQSASTPRPSIRGDQSFQLRTNIAPGFTLAAVGDGIMPQPISMLPSFEPVRQLIQGADVAFVNFEGTVVDVKDLPTWVEAETGGGALIYPPSVPQDMKAMGFDLVSRANNHALDLGVAGMEATTDVLRQVGLVQAGVGKSQAAAGAAGYLNTSFGRVAIVSVASTFTPMSRSGPPAPGEPPRPGVNALRTTLYHLVSPEEMKFLRALRSAQPPGSVPDVAYATQPREADKNRLSLFDSNYMIGKNHGQHYEMNADDLRRIKLDIENAKKSSDFVIVSLHAHEPGNWSQQPADFETTFAHIAIDSGADAVIGHGPHQLRGIEVYKGRPILYSLGNFVFQADISQPVESDLYESFEFDPAKISAVDLNTYFTSLDFGAPEIYQSAIVGMTFGHEGVSEIRVTPLDLHQSARAANRGVPTVASGTVAREILERMQRLSKAFGVELKIENDVGIIRVTPGSVN